LGYQRRYAVDGESTAPRMADALADGISKQFPDKVGK
jgi:hypothetical protein